MSFIRYSWGSVDVLKLKRDLKGTPFTDGITINKVTTDFGKQCLEVDWDERSVKYNGEDLARIGYRQLPFFGDAVLITDEIEKLSEEDKKVFEGIIDRHFPHKTDLFILMVYGMFVYVGIVLGGIALLSEIL